MLKRTVEKTVREELRITSLELLGAEALVENAIARRDALRVRRDRLQDHHDAHELAAKSRDVVDESFIEWVRNGLLSVKQAF